jgi:hypothetical protein
MFVGGVAVMIFCNAIVPLTEFGKQPYKILEDGYVVTIADKLWFVGWGIGILTSFEFARKCISLFKEQLYIYYLIADLFCGLAVGNMADELFFKPNEVEAGEYAGLVIGVAWVIYEIRKRKNRINKPPNGKSNQSPVGTASTRDGKNRW